MALLLTPRPPKAPRTLGTAILRYYDLYKAEQDSETRLGAVRVSEGESQLGTGWMGRKMR